MLPSEDATEQPAPSPASTIFHDASEMPIPPQDELPSTSQQATSSKPRQPSLKIVTNDTRTDSKPSLAVLNGQVHHSPTAEQPREDPTALTALRAHYLKKSLITLQFSQELQSITTTFAAHPNLSPLSYLGAPFTPPPKGAPKQDMPFLKYMFRQFVLTFPFVSSAPKDFFPQKLQPFVGSLLARNLSTTDDVLGMDDPGVDPELASRKKLLAKAEKYFALLLGSATKLVEHEEVVRLSQKDLDRLEALARKRAARAKKTRDIFEVNIVSVRTVTEKSRHVRRSRVHEEFIIRTRRADMPDVFVSRRYGDFKTLADELRKAHPEQELSPPPPKDRTAIDIPATAASSSFPSGISSSTPTSATRPPVARSDTVMTTGSAESVNISKSNSSTAQASRLAREKNRLTLRAYLHSLLTHTVIASSPVLRHFLLSGPTELTSEEIEDSERREEADRIREQGRRKFASEIAARVDGLRDSVRAVKGDMMGKNGLTNIFAAIKKTPNVRDLPKDYQAVLEWGRITLAATLFQTYIAADDSSESFAGLKRIHGIMPYFMLRGILRVSNPMAMIRGVLELFLAQPFGGRSLLQRMFTSNLTEEARALQEDIDTITESVGDPILCEKVKRFVYAPKEVQAVFRQDAVNEGVNILTVILRSGEQPPLSRIQMQRVIKSAKAHQDYLRQLNGLEDSDDDDGPADDDAWLYEDLNVLAKLYSRLRDKEQLIDLLFEGTTSDLLKDIITIFYSPLAQVYKAANIADSVADFQSFVNDLIQTVDRMGETSQTNPSKAVQAFIDLVQRHEQSFYSFVHKVHSKGEGLFDSLMHWIELFLTMTREGLGQPVSLEFILPHTGAEREALMKEIDAITLYHYKLKIAYEEKVRKRFGRAEAASSADAEDEQVQELVNGVVRDLSFGDLVKGDANDIAAEDTESSEDDESDEEEEDSSEYETGTSDEGSTDEESEEEQASDKPPKLPPKGILKPLRPPHTTVTSATPTTASTPSSSASQTPTSAQAPRPARPVLRNSGAYDTSNTSTVSSAPAGVLTFNTQSAKKDLPPVPQSAGPSGQPKHLQPPPRRNGHSRNASGSSIIHTVKRKKRRPAGLQLEHPEMTQIPKLLPLFMEMVFPMLKPRKV